MIIEKDVKVNRILTIYSKLLKRGSVNKKEMAELFNVNERTIQRDLEDIRAYFCENREGFGIKEIVYRRDKKGYCLNNIDDVLTREDALVIIKILLESRAFCNYELNHLINSILGQVNNEQIKEVKYVIGNELINYVPLKHNDMLISKIWDLSELIKNKQLTRITYLRNDGEEVQREIKPVSIIFSEYYFYLIAYSNKFDSPTVFRIDRIKKYEVKNEKFIVNYSERFEDGEFRKRIQFMYPGKLMKIKLEVNNISIEATLDRMPIAKVIKTLENKSIIEAEVYGNGIIMWILSQRCNIRVLEPIELVEEIKNEIKELSELY